MPTGGQVTNLLKRVGFEANPFGLREADREKSRYLASYFFPHHIFREVLGSSDEPESTVVWAERGGGKTTLRQAIELFCRENRRPVEGALAVPYTHFSRLVNRANKQGQPVDINLHVETILQYAVERLLYSLDEERAGRLAAMPRGHRAMLSGYLRRYSKLLRPQNQGQALTDLFEALAADNEVELQIDPADLLGADGAQVQDRLPPSLQPIAALLRQLDAQDPSLPDRESYLQLMSDFLKITQRAGFKCMYVLVDRVDESSLVNDERLAVRCLEPLITSHDLLDMPGLAVKFFLPQHLQEPLQDSIDFRRQRLAIHHLAWNEQDLLRLLKIRLRAFSKHGESSMAVFCEPQLAQQLAPGYAPRASERMVDVALVSASSLPRDLVLRCRALFDSYEARAGTGLINEQDLEYALSRDLREGIRRPRQRDELAPPDPQPAATGAPGERIPPRGLYVDGNKCVWRDGQKLGEIQPQSSRLLEYLCQHRYQLCPRRDILAGVWAPGEQDYVLTSALSRLRHEVELDPKQPRYIITVPAQGVRLEDG